MKIAPKPNPTAFRRYSSLAQDKSLSHRSVIFSFLTSGECEIQDFLRAEDTNSTLQIAKVLGASVREEGQKLLLTPPSQIVSKAQILCNNAGTAMRLYAGLLASREGGVYEFVGDESLSKRPMDRIKTPLERLGAKLSSSYAPFTLYPNKLRGIHFHSPVASAQVKGAFILASLFAQTPSSFSEPELSRDHSERFLSSLGVEILIQNKMLHIAPLKKPLSPYSFVIPNDPSSVIFFVIACLIGKNLQAEFENVLLNPTRIEAFEVLKKMGANLSYEIRSERIEPVGIVRVASSSLVGVKVEKNIAWLIDEIPALSIAFACARGVSEVRGAKELKVKESNRINSIVSNLKALGIEACELEDGLRVQGGEFRSAKLKSFGDHRIAMSFALVGMKKEIELEGSECIEISFPRFFEFLSEYVEVVNGS